MKKFWPILSVILIVFGLIAYGRYKINVLEKELTEVMFSKDSVVVVNDSVTAYLTTERKNNAQLKGSLETANKLNADLLAYMKIKIKPDTVIHDSIVYLETTTTNRTRTARFVDTSKAGILDANLVAPPDPSPLGFSYKFYPAPIDLGVAFLRTKDNKAVFVVTYSGGQTEVEAPYGKLPKTERRLLGYLEGMYAPFVDNHLAIRAGGQFRTISSIYLFSELQQRFLNDSAGEMESPSFYIGIRKQF